MAVINRTSVALLATILAAAGCTVVEEPVKTGSDTDTDTDTDTDSDTDADTDSDTDTDTDTDVDTDTDADVFMPWAVGFNFDGAYDSAADSWGTATFEYKGYPGEFPPFFELVIYDERGWGNEDPRYQCSFVYSGFGGEPSFSTDEVYVGVMLPKGTPLASNCGTANGGLLDWGTVDSPVSDPNSEAGEGWAVGFGEMNSKFVESLSGAVEDAGLDWDNDWAPYTLAGGWMAADKTGDVLVQSSYASVFETDEDLVLTIDGGYFVQLQADQVAVQKPTGMYTMSSWYFFYWN
jgi:hypothetical protein